MKIRVVKTASKARAVQVIRYQKNKRLVLHHVGSAHSDSELEVLMLSAQEWIKDYSKQLSIFPDENPNKLLHLNHCTFIGIQYHYFYQQIKLIQDMLMFGDLPPLLNDLVCIRIFEPASKLRSLELMEQFFGLKHSRKSYYRIAPQCIELKESVENKVVAFAQRQYSFNFDIVFYDVTTLYFETFEEDELRKNGFSSKHPSNPVLPDLKSHPILRDEKKSKNFTGKKGSIGSGLQEFRDEYGSVVSETECKLSHF